MKIIPIKVSIKRYLFMNVWAGIINYLFKLNLSLGDVVLFSAICSLYTEEKEVEEDE